MDYMDYMGYMDYMDYVLQPVPESRIVRIEPATAVDISLDEGQDGVAPVHSGDFSKIAMENAHEKK